MSTPGLPGLPRSLRLRLVLGLSVVLCLIWGSVAAWMFTNMQRELRSMLDERLIASTRTVAGLVQQLQPQFSVHTPTLQPQALKSMIARDGVACEVSLVRSEVEVLPIARTEGSPDLSALARTGFGQIEKGGKTWRTYVLEENGIRVATADRLDLREHLVQSFGATLVVPFVLALLGLLALTWWICTVSLQPLKTLRQELQARPPADPNPVQTGRNTAELAPLVDSLNQLLARSNAAMEHERRWTADAAHELRTPLTAIKTHVQVAQLLVARQAGPLPDQTQAQQLGAALEQASLGMTHMQSVLEQLLLLARLENGAEGEGLEMDGVAMRDALVLACAQARQRQLQQLPQLPNGLAVDIEIQPAALELPALQALRLALAPALLTSAIGNLLDNALRHQPLGQAVRLSWAINPPAEAAAQAAQLHICVEDQGPGMSELECQLATSRFWRKRADGAGSGLGLTIVSRIAASVGGSLQLQPRAPGPGLRACLILPLLSS